MISPLRGSTQSRPRQLTLPLSFQEDGGMMPIEISELLAHQANYRRSSSILSFISEESICLNGDDGNSRPTTPGNKKKGGVKSAHGSSREHMHSGMNMNNTNSSNNRDAAAGKSSSSSPLTTEEMGSEDVALGTSRNCLIVYSSQ